MTRPPLPPASGPRPPGVTSPRLRKPLLSRISPPQLIALNLAAAILVGTLLLSLPLSPEPGQSVTSVQALFRCCS